MKKNSIGFVTLPFIFTSCLLFSCGESEQSSLSENLTEEEAASYVSPIVSDLESETSDLHGRFYGPRRVFIDYRNVDCEITFITDIANGYYYHTIKCWHDDVSDYVISARWLYGGEDSFSAGYIATQEDGTLVKEEKWTYDGALKYMQRIAKGTFDSNYIYALSYIGTDSDSNYEFVSFIKEADGGFAYEWKRNYAPGVSTYHIDAKDNLPTKISLANPSYETNDMDMDFYFGSDITKIYPTLENADELEFVDPS